MMPSRGSAIRVATLLSYSAKSTDYERLAWYNPSASPQTHHVMVYPYDGAVADYTLRIRTSDWHDDRDCDDIYDETATSPGRAIEPCSSPMQSPRTRATS